MKIGIIGHIAHDVKEAIVRTLHQHDKLEVFVLNTEEKTFPFRAPAPMPQVTKVALAPVLFGSNDKAGSFGKYNNRKCKDYNKSAKKRKAQRKARKRN